MKNGTAKWIVGHRVRPVEVSGDYDLVRGETPAHTPGPPPHYHTGFNELFYVIEGEMEFMVNGELKIIGPGESVDLPPNALHTFSNNSSKTCLWLNVHSPKGFLAFFNDLGIDESSENAQAESVSDEMISRLMRDAESYDMHIKI